ncbi:hypothetical protein M758_9G150900 [Ceratodon purpureus]|uniref:Uncharacterized protein n=1 Tax=Ceratodon purpureus TaxID=3225 RepID=A0A8T0GRT8_CERPU|nr:hypothetical protein KC19_9G141100 [Ceratodon purpureus]KAG0562382.1 hypothetical protein KC19_9G141700 [Ceratodon purpureus]KAG0606554.1 hypothetical protein M758_9G150600 [Ceratodon purpureus]KAG0606557.1 hypothetical protein M758_9G150900 [Ceratodon purpureus]
MSFSLNPISPCCENTSILKKEDTHLWTSPRAVIKLVAHSKKILSIRVYMVVIQISGMIERCTRGITIGNYLNIRILELDCIVKLHVIAWLTMRS